MKLLRFKRYFTKQKNSNRLVNVDVTDEVKTVTAEITGVDGETIFKQENVKAPINWSQTAINIVASKYFRGQLDSPSRESSIDGLINRVVDTISAWGWAHSNYFRANEDVKVFQEELKFLLWNQMASFNSPVWFNCGVEDKPQCSACFINSVEDSMESILDLAKTEGMLFKYGSGTGTNFSTLRPKNATLSGGGSASGPLSFLKGFDAFAGAIKSGGKNRRAAKMVILDASHPDVEEFIDCKFYEEQKAWALIDAGYSPGIDGEAYGSVFFQNSNNSVRFTDDDMEAREPLLEKMAESAYLCGDPGIQFTDTINKWHTCGASSPINASNPCSEYFFVDDSACNLASLNLLKFVNDDKEFDTEAFQRAVRLMITAQEIIVSMAGYPTEKIADNSFQFRPLGLGYANLGALLMSFGIPYDSDRGRYLAASITSLMTATAYLQSANIAEKCSGPFALYKKNQEDVHLVMLQHIDAADELVSVVGSKPSDDASGAIYDCAVEALRVWSLVREKTAEGSSGIRNAQVTVIAPTGTIGLMMDCGTTGVEPEFSLRTSKTLVGGGEISLPCKVLPEALDALDYTQSAVMEFCDWVRDGGDIRDKIPVQEHSVFACAVGENAISPQGHLKMVAAIQPFLSGGVSKTINLPAKATVIDIYNVYEDAWRLGLKSVSVYRDKSKRSQPLGVMEDVQAVIGPAADPMELVLDVGEDFTVESSEPELRKRPPNDREAVIHRFDIGGHKGYLTVGLFEDGTPCEIFINMAKEGSTISGLMDSFACMTSFALQYGVPLDFLVKKLEHTRFEPSGWTGNKDVPYAKSIIDYIFRWLARRFLESADATGGETVNGQESVAGGDLTCPSCGSLMSPNGSCYKCSNCGETSGCS